MDVHLNPKTGRDWMLPGHRRLVVTPGKNQERFIAGALNATTKKLTWVQAPSKGSALFCSLVGKLLGEYRHARRIHLIVDHPLEQEAPALPRPFRRSSGSPLPPAPLPG